VAPANDDFANREVLSGSLPIEVTRSNVEATKEAGEFIPSGPAPAGRSVWFEWEATTTGWITVGACDDEFPTILAIFTGSEVGNLTQVASGNQDEGPDCPYSQRQYTFKAVNGTKYAIAVDGNVFHMPEAPMPVVEGKILLRIAPTPPPPNDDFANATLLEAPISEEPGGDRFYLADARGYNWTATTEVGEPFYGTSSGASVWYSWRAPESGRYRFGGPCCGTGLNWGLYGGDSLADLTPFLAATGSAEVEVSVGTTYRIVVYGTPDLDTGEPTMGSFGFLISANLPPLPPASPRASGSSGGAPPDLLAPETTISKRVLRRMPPILTLRFHSSEVGSTFRCRLDGRPFAVCGFSRTYSTLKPGWHKFEVFAVDAARNKDPTPATARFKIPQLKPHNAKG
jgi:hypothetical protein